MVMAIALKFSFGHLKSEAFSRWELLPQAEEKGQEVEKLEDQTPKEVDNLRSAASLVPKPLHSSKTQPWAGLGCRHSPSSLSRGSSQVFGANPRCPRQGTVPVPLPPTRTWNSSEVQRSSQAARTLFPTHQTNQRTPNLPVYDQKKKAFSFSHPCQVTRGCPSLRHPLAQKAKRSPVVKHTWLLFIELLAQS